MLKKCVFICLILFIGFSFAGCERLLNGDGDSANVGAGNTFIGIIIFGILTPIVGGIGFLLGMIPVIGKFIRILTAIGIILFWLLFIFCLIWFYGLINLLIGIILAMIVAGGAGGYTVYVLIFF